jgi:hypothetical protein
MMRRLFLSKETAGGRYVVAKAKDDMEKSNTIAKSDLKLFWQTISNPFIDLIQLAIVELSTWRHQHMAACIIHRAHQSSVVGRQCYLIITNQRNSGGRRTAAVASYAIGVDDWLDGSGKSHVA